VKGEILFNFQGEFLMTNKKFIFSLLCIVLVFCLGFSFVQIVSATKYNVIDEGFGPVNDSKKNFDSGREPLSNVAHADISWKSYLFHGKKILVWENFHSSVQDINTTTLIEIFGKNKLKIFTKIDSSSFNGENSKDKSTIYVKTSLNPNEYYFKVFKPKMLKHVLRDQIFERAFGLLKESKTKLYWNTHVYLNKKFIRDKLTINRGFSHWNLTYDKITIEKYSKNQLKITYKANKTSESNYINTKLLPWDYYYNIYRSEMIEIFNKSTIGYYGVVDK